MNIRSHPVRLRGYVRIWALLLASAACSPALPASLGLPPGAEGLDLSHHNGAVDWVRLAGEPIDFVYLKATEGRDHKDKAFQAHWQAAHQHGFAAGAYHFYRLCVPASMQAANFIQSVEVRTDALPPAVDLEYHGNCEPFGTPSETRAELRTFLDALETEYGKRPVIYTTSDFHADWIAGALDDYPLWIRSLEGAPSQPHVLWQYSMKGRVSGIEGLVDRNRIASD